MSALFPVVSPDIGFVIAAVSDFTILILESPFWPALLRQRTVWRSSYRKRLYRLECHIFPGPVSRSILTQSTGVLIWISTETGFIFFHIGVVRALI